MQIPKNIVIVDICGTLFHSNTTFDFLDFYLKSKKYQRFRKISQNILIKILNSILFYLFRLDVIRWYAILHLNGANLKELNTYMNYFYDSILKYKINHSVLLKINELAKEKQLVLVSATLDFIALTISQKLNIPLFFSTELKYDNFGTCKGKIEKDLLGNKLYLLKRYFLDKKYDTVITDNFSDKTLFLQNTINYVVTSEKNKKKWNNFAMKRKIQIQFIH